MWTWNSACLGKTEVDLNIDTYIVGGLGFLGVILTLYANARLARKMRTNEIASERKIIVIALLEELDVILNQIKYCKGLIEEFDLPSLKFINFPIHRENLIFETSSEKLGLLSENQIRSIMKMYSYHREFYTRLFIVLDTVPNNPYFVQVPKSKVDRLSELLNELENRASDARCALSAG